MTIGVEQQSDSVVADFLETALVVDDEAGLLISPEPNQDVATQDVDAERSAGSRLDLELAVPSEDTLQAASQDHPLRAKALIDAFADQGIVCGVLAPLKGDQIQDRVLKAAVRADLLVLDWELHRDGGKTARQLIKAVLDQDANAPRKRLRVIAIYTGQPELSRIMQDVRGHLAVAEEAIQDEGMTLTQDNFRITAFSKPLEDDLPPELVARQVHEADLPIRLATEFARLTEGLVPAVAMAALAAVRTDTHRILQALRRDLDIGYLGHRVASGFPEDAEAHLVEMVSAEIASVLSENNVGAYADLAAIRIWLERAQFGDDSLKCGSALQPPQTVTAEALEKMLTIGLGLDEELSRHTGGNLSGNKLKAIRKKAAHLFTNDAHAAEASADIFGLRMAVRTIYTRPPRLLRLGTIVLHADEYLVCLQPVCDSIRLDPGVPRGFPFLPLMVADTDDPRHDFVVQSPEDDGLVRLRLQAKPQHLISFSFLCGPTRTVEARNSRGRWIFSDMRPRQFRWVAELKPEFAQRVAVNLAAEIARVGLTESELVRLSQRA